MYYMKPQKPNLKVMYLMTFKKFFSGIKTSTHKLFSLSSLLQEMIDEL